MAVYFEIDSWLPETNHFWELCANNNFNVVKLDGQRGYRVRSRAMRSTNNGLSQGLVYPLSHFPEEIETPYKRRIAEVGEQQATQELLSMSFGEKLGVKKWEDKKAVLDIPHEFTTGFGFEESGDSSSSSGMVMPVRMPDFIKLPYWQRVQNMVDLIDVFGRQRNTVWQITEKLDGLTMHVFRVKPDFVHFDRLPWLDEEKMPASMRGGGGKRGEGRVGVCCRNREWFDDGKGPGKVFWDAARRAGVLDKLGHPVFKDKNFVIQGEVYGSRIERNPIGLNDGEHGFSVFGIWDLDTMSYLPARTVERICKELKILHVPVIDYAPVSKYATNLEELLAFAEQGPSRLGEGILREGYVFKSLDCAQAFKVISNEWLRVTGK